MSTPLAHQRMGFGLCPNAIVTARPLVVIDPEDREQVERLADIFCARPSSGWVEQMQTALREFADPKPPKPDEPTGLGAVVEVDGGVRFVRLPDGMWTSEDESQPWQNVNAICVLSEGVQS